MRRNVIMSLILGSVFVWFFNNRAEPTITILRDASNLLRGTLPNARLDPSSVTLQGNSVNFSTIGAGLNNVIQGIGMNNSSYTLQGNTVNLSTTAQGVQSLYSGNVNASSYTLQGNQVTISTVAMGLNAIINGTMGGNPSTFTLQGNRIDISSVASGLNGLMPLLNSTPTLHGLVVNGSPVFKTSATIQQNLCLQKNLNFTYYPSTISMTEEGRSLENLATKYGQVGAWGMFSSDNVTNKRNFMNVKYDDVSNEYLMKLDGSGNSQNPKVTLDINGAIVSTSIVITGADGINKITISASSITLQGNTLSISTISQGVTNLYEGNVNASSYTLQGNNINISTVASGVNNLNFHAVNFSSGGVFLNAVSTFGVIFQTGGSSKFHVTADSATLTIADNVGSGSSSAGIAKTTTVVTFMQGGGDLSISTDVFEAIPGVSNTIGRATWTITAFRFEVVSIATQNANGNGTCGFRIAETTTTDTGGQFSYITAATTTIPNTKYSNWISTAGVFLYPDRQYSIHVTTVPEFTAPTRGVRLKLIRWLDDEP